GGTGKTAAFRLAKPNNPKKQNERNLPSGHPHPSSPIRRKGTRGDEEGVKFPALGLTVSGGHTMLVVIKKIGQYKILGQTVDDAAGECFDKTAKILGLPYPGGPALSKLAKHGNPRAIDFPRPMIDSKNYNFSFSGLKTAVLYFLRDYSPRPSSPGEIGVPQKSQSDFKGVPEGKMPTGQERSKLNANIAASVEQAIVDVLVSKTIRAAKEYKVKTILLGGGVSANQKLRKELNRAIKINLNAKFLIPNSDLTTDNAGMIALAGFFHFLNGHFTTYDKINANQNWELKSWRI
ncbi:hypothetical protein D4R52_00680, partial [bacterium]